MARIALLANPDSGSGDADDVASRLRSHGAEVDSFGLDEAERVASASPERIVVAGGDGSIGCAAGVAAQARLPLAVVPVGTANDFASAMGLPDDLDEACELAATGTETRPLDLARMDGRPFVNVASLGLAPAAARRAHGLKGALGPAAYAVGAIRAGVATDPTPCRVLCDGNEVFSGSAWQATVACTGAFGAGVELDASPHDGLLDVVVIEAGSRAGLMVRAYGLRRGTIGSQRGVHTARGRDAEVELDGREDFNVDGEVLASEDARFEVEAGAVEAVVG
jgi:YegS/Rv2252/BmrU family lipid kinase